MEEDITFTLPSMMCSPSNEKVHEKKIVTLKDSQKKICQRYKIESNFATKFHANNIKSRSKSGVLGFHFNEDGVAVLFPLAPEKFN